jgi:hypothetical protein
MDEEGDPIFDVETEVEFADPLEVVELTFAPHGVTFPEPGEYRLQLFGAGEQSSGAIRLPEGETLNRVSLAWMKKYASPKPLFRPKTWKERQEEAKEPPKPTGE